MPGDQIPWPLQPSYLAPMGPSGYWMAGQNSTLQSPSGSWKSIFSFLQGVSSSVLEEPVFCACSVTWQSGKPAIASHKSLITAEPQGFFFLIINKQSQCLFKVWAHSLLRRYGPVTSYRGLAGRADITAPFGPSSPGSTRLEGAQMSPFQGPAGKVSCKQTGCSAAPVTLFTEWLKRPNVLGRPFKFIQLYGQVKMWFSTSLTIGSS